MSRPDFDEMVAWVEALFVGPWEIGERLAVEDWYRRRIEEGDVRAVLRNLPRDRGLPKTLTKGFKREMAAAAVAAVVAKYGVTKTRRGGGMADASAGSACDVVAMAFGLGYKTVEDYSRPPS